MTPAEIAALPFQQTETGQILPIHTHIKHKDDNGATCVVGIRDNGQVTLRTYDSDDCGPFVDITPFISQLLALLAARQVHASV